MISFLSAFLASAFSAISRLPFAFEKISGASASALRDFAISTALRASYNSSGICSRSGVMARGFPSFSYWLRFISLYSFTGNSFPFVFFRVSLSKITISLGRRTAKYGSAVTIIENVCAGVVAPNFASPFLLTSNSPRFPVRPSGVTIHTTYVRSSAPSFEGCSKLLTVISIFVFPCLASTLASPLAWVITSVPFKSTLMLPLPTGNPIAVTDLLTRLDAVAFCSDCAAAVCADRQSTRQESRVALLWLIKCSGSSRNPTKKKLPEWRDATTAKTNRYGTGPRAARFFLEVYEVACQSL